MLKKTAIIILSTFIGSQLFYSCGNSGNKEANSKTSPKVSIYYLHQPKSCKTCKAVGKISRSTTEKYFQKELEKGTLAYFDLDISQPSNDSIGRKFECAWSGLYLLSVVDGKEVKEDLTDVAFMYAVNKPDTLEQIIKSSLAKKL
jgi:hypothetical protein